MLEDFFSYQAQTTPHPLAIEVSHAQGSYIFDRSGKRYLDFVAGVSACSLGHCHPAVINAVKEQLDRYLHVMVYGEYIQTPAVALAKLLAEKLPAPLESTYLVNSGAEAIDGAMKLARRVTGRSEILYAHHAYHGNTFGALSVMGFEERKTPFGPLIPHCHAIAFNSEKDLKKITTKTAAVILETIQGGAGFIQPENDYLMKVRERCDATGTLLILDEIQPGFGRTGTLFGFEQF
ncbi:MAG: aminotransferase class III-fold pyridoxal phosphate-dependent enzyme, partial [Altibacter sp.]|nr:aminotransferase class III-fold pyridoxal phosphate-dependent enzyme [Altibacter sp.]